MPPMKREREEEDWSEGLFSFWSLLLDFLCSLEGDMLTLPLHLLNLLMEDEDYGFFDPEVPAVNTTTEEMSIDTDGFFEAETPTKVPSLVCHAPPAIPKSPQIPIPHFRMEKFAAVRDWKHVLYN